MGLSMESEIANQVAIPLSWFLSTIAGLAGVIGLLARTIFSLQNQRADEARGDTETVVTALNDNTQALNKMTDVLTSGGS